MSYYDREGKPLELMEFAKLFERERKIGDDVVNNHHVSTVWLGIDHSFGAGPPLIFETMIFCRHEPVCDLDQWQARYATEAAAQAGHAKAVKLAEEVA